MEGLGDTLSGPELLVLLLPGMEYHDDSIYEALFIVSATRFNRRERLGGNDRDAVRR
jgi:hypothetical protein